MKRQMRTTLHKVPKDENNEIQWNFCRNKTILAIHVQCI